MSAEPLWIARKVIVLLQEESIAEFGGVRGLREEGLLESALARPQNSLAYASSASLFDLAASYGYGFAKMFHPFADGNKRAGFLSIGLFLWLNGYRLTASQIDAIETMLGVAAGTVLEPELALWITQNSKER